MRRCFCLFFMIMFVSAVSGDPGNGKGRVRIAKVRRNPNGVQEVMQMDVQVIGVIVLWQYLISLFIIDPSSRRYHDRFFHSRK